MEEKKDKGFTVKDKRIFSSDAETPADDAASRQEPSGTEPDAAEAQQQPNEDAAPPLPDITFSSFIISLSSSALFHFGEIPDPITNKKQRNLPLAKQTIDILGILKEKTVGNLTNEESRLLDNLLYDLRMRYVNEMQSRRA